MNGPSVGLRSGSYFIPATTTGNVTAASSVPSATAPDTVRQPLILNRKDIRVRAGWHRREQHDQAGR